MINTLYLEQNHWEVMRDHVAAAAPLEGCGLLGGRDARVKVVIPMQNQAQSPVRFRLDPAEQLKAFEWLDSQGLELVGIFHSHPAGPETVSATDIAEAAYAVVHIVWSRPRGEWQARGFWIESGEVRPVALQIV